MRAPHFALFFAVFGLGIALITMMHVAHVDDTPHSCVAPCTVRLPTGTQEDEFGLDYRHGGTVKVWVRPHV